MKTYTLSVALFKELEEITSSIDYLQENFPGLLHTGLIETYTDSLHPEMDGEELKRRIKLDIILQFNNYFLNEDNNWCSDVYNLDADNWQLKLCKDFSLELGEKGINLSSNAFDFAIREGLLVETNFILLTSVEIKFIKEALATYGEAIHKSDLYFNIMKKFSNE
jgi:hypothetical protein